MMNALMQYPRDFCLLACDSNYFFGQQISKLNQGIRGKMEGDVKLKKGASQKRSTRKSKATQVVEPTATGSVEEIPEAKPGAKRKQSSATGNAKTGARKKAAGHPSVEQIQLRAYFIAERRRRLGLPGDETADWVQAERELTTDNR
jgi:hypothetical protein